MYTRSLLITIFFFCSGILASQSKSRAPKVWSFSYYEFAGNLNHDDVFKDTLYTIQKFPPANDWKIYFDSLKGTVATIIHFDSINRTLTTKHYQRNGKLIWEYCTGYKNKKSCNPASSRLNQLKYIKIFRADSLICEMTGQEQLISVRYRNYFSEVFFDQTMYFSTVDSWRDDFIGSDVWKYYKNGNLKSVCKTVREDDTEATILFLTCKDFDMNGCLIKDK